MIELERLGFSFFESKTNFIFTRHKEVAGLKIYEELRKRKIFVRYFNKPRISDYIRITIGTDEQMKILIEVMKDIVG